MAQSSLSGSRVLVVRNAMAVQVSGLALLVACALLLLLLTRRLLRRCFYLLMLRTLPITRIVDVKVDKQFSSRLEDRSEREKEEERERRRATRSGGSGWLGSCVPGQRAPSARKFLTFSNSQT